MRHAIAETIDLCIEKLCVFVTHLCSPSPDTLIGQLSSLMVPVEKRKMSHEQLYKTLIKAFEQYVLPTHKTIHVQFVMFYFCSFKVS